MQGLKPQRESRGQQHTGEETVPTEDNSYTPANPNIISGWRKDR